MYHTRRRIRSMFATVELPVARAYQDELAACALSQNTILAMGTGTGKMLISDMVLRSKLATGPQPRFVQKKRN